MTTWRRRPLALQGNFDSQPVRRNVTELAESLEASDEDVQRKESVGNGVVDDIRTILALGAGVADQLSLPLLHHRLITGHRRPSRDVARAHLCVCLASS